MIFAWKSVKTGELSLDVFANSKERLFEVSGFGAVNVDEPIKGFLAVQVKKENGHWKAVVEDESSENSVDDRGNVVDIYVDGESTGRLDREADPIPEIDENETLAWEGGKDEIAVAIEHGYGEEVAIAILCSFLRGDTTAREQAIDYLQVAFTVA